MENRRGSGIFLGVVSVATLIVAIIGATFAFFSASITAENTVDATAYEFDADIKLTAVDTPTGKMIPLLPEGELAEGISDTYTTNLMYAMNEAGCIDSRGYLVCTVYDVEVTNNGTESITLSGVLTTTKNEHPKVAEGNTNKFVNLKYVALELDGESYSYGETLSEAEGGNVKALPAEEGKTLALETMQVAAGETEHTYFVVYLNDTNEEGDVNTQNSEMGAVYSGQVTYTDSLSGSKLTGTFTVAGE